MAVVNGNTGALSVGSTVAKFRTWSLDWTSEIKKGAHSDSAGWKEGAVGPMDWKGSFSTYLTNGTIQTALDTAISGRASVAFSGTSFTGATFTGSVFVTGISGVGADVEGGGLASATYTFEGTGALTRTTS